MRHTSVPTTVVEHVSANKSAHVLAGLETFQADCAAILLEDFIAACCAHKGPRAPRVAQRVQIQHVGLDWESDFERCCGVPECERVTPL
eukprot:3678330-Alexandrium_andersonii.AAC.1